MNKKQNRIKVIIIVVLIVILLAVAFLLGKAAGQINNMHSISQGDSTQTEKEEDVSVSDSIFDLIAAWDNFMKADVQQTDLNMKFNFGALGIDEAFTVKTGTVNDIQISHIQRGNLDIYICDGKVFVEDDNAHFNVNYSDEYNEINMRRVFAAAYEICTKGDFDIKTVENKTVYTLTLTQQQIEDILSSVQNTSQTVKAVIEKGELTVVVENKQLEKMQLICTGYTEILSAKVEGKISIETELSTPAQPIILPPAVEEQIK